LSVNQQISNRITDNIPRHFLLLPVVWFGRPQAAVLGQILHVIEHALGEQVW
jgi:hypothetical protein